MKLIDKKGRIFGLVNLVDLLIILFVCAGIIGVLKFQDIKGAFSSFNSSESGDIFVTYSVSGVKIVSYDGIVIGDTFFEEDTKKVVGEVVEKSCENAQIATTDGKGKFLYSEIPDRYDVLFKIKASGSYDDMNVVLNGKSIHIGEKVEINSRFSNFTAIIYDIEIK